LSVSDALLIFLDIHNQFEGWLHVRGRSIAARGKELDGVPPLLDSETGRPIGLVAVVPGEMTSLHWLEVPAGLAPAQAAAAARLMASEVSAQPLEQMHVAVGPAVDGSPLRAVALVPARVMAGWLSKLQEEGLDPDLVLPEPLLLRPPAEGFVRYDRREVPIYRGAADAFSLEPDIAGIITASAPIEAVGAEAFEGGIFEAIARPPVNLRQGAFAKRRRWKIEWKLVRRLALLLAAILVVSFAIQVVSIWRYTYAADALEAEADRIAAGALPGRRSGPVTDAPAQLEQELADLRGSGAGYAALASVMFAAVRATPNAELSAILYDRDGSMRATVMADSPATISALEQRIEANGFAVESGPLRTGGGKPTADLTVQAR
jgi:general secretion pathway protein L